METQYGRLDKPRVEAAVREFLLAIGEDPDREGLQGTPDRVARACEEIFGGMQEDPATYLRKQFREPGNEDLLAMRTSATFRGTAASRGSRRLPVACLALLAGHSFRSASQGRLPTPWGASSTRSESSL